jgi:hypothetical protein
MDSWSIKSIKHLFYLLKNEAEPPGLRINAKNTLQRLACIHQLGSQDYMPKELATPPKKTHQPPLQSHLLPSSACAFVSKERYSVMRSISLKPSDRELKEMRKGEKLTSSTVFFIMYRTMVT